MTVNRLVQSNWLEFAVDLNDIASTFHTSVDTLPAVIPNRPLDWAYGDVREVSFLLSLTHSIIPQPSAEVNIASMNQNVIPALCRC